MPPDLVSPPPRPRRIVVTGTGTAIGKTFVSVELLTLLSAGGNRCLGLKPVETGYVDPEQSDASALARAAGHPLHTPYFTSREPVSPHRAARVASDTLSPAAIALWVETHTAATTPDVVLIETAGGLFSPLHPSALNLDLVRALEPCTFVLVAPDRLGGLHDVLCAVTAARAVHRAPDLICMNLQDKAAMPLENASELAQFAGIPRVIQAPLVHFMKRDAVARLFASMGASDETPQ